uniref:NADH-ubiquinone oxidoreductase chain 6 n=1 Tax=Curculionidae sp. BMNH 1039956 TaxID=1903770 RepID=A0A343A5T4_9CUCU|nr:NADH dehydrogenase subunit 6 [Curculionidae sp. BMNH 1039956]
MIMVFMSITSLTLNHPMLLMLTLLIQTTLISLSMGMMYPNFWFSYMMFLILIGSILILFTYMTSVASNEKFTLNYKMISLNTILSVIVILLMPTFNNKIFKSTETNMMSDSLSLKKTFFYSMNMSFIIAVIYLLFTLIVVVKMTENKNMPFMKN